MDQDPGVGIAVICHQDHFETDSTTVDSDEIRAVVVNEERISGVPEGHHHVAPVADPFPGLRCDPDPRHISSMYDILDIVNGCRRSWPLPR